MSRDPSANQSNEAGANLSMLSSSHFCTSQGKSELGASHARSGTQASQHVRQAEVLAIPTPLRSLSFVDCGHICSCSGEASHSPCTRLVVGKIKCCCCSAIENIISQAKQYAHQKPVPRLCLAVLPPPLCPCEADHCVGAISFTPSSARRCWMCS